MYPAGRQPGARFATVLGPTRAEDLEFHDPDQPHQPSKTLFYGSTKMKPWLQQPGLHLPGAVEGGLQRLMRLTGLEAIYRRPITSKPASSGHLDRSLSAEAEWRLHRGRPGLTSSRISPDITKATAASWYLGGYHGLARMLATCIDLEAFRQKIAFPSFSVAAMEEALGKGRP